MTPLKALAMTAAMLLVSACASNGYAGGYGHYPNQGYYSNGYYDQGYYHGNGGYGYDGGYAYADRGDGRWFRPENGVICDHASNICYDRRGPSYDDSKQYFGKKRAKRAFNRLEDQDAQFWPRPGVTCDPRTGACYDSRTPYSNQPQYWPPEPGRPGR